MFYTDIVLKALERLNALCLFKDIIYTVNDKSQGEILGIYFIGQ